MKLQDLQRAVDNIQIDPAMQEDIIRQVKERTSERGEDLEGSKKTRNQKEDYQVAGRSPGTIKGQKGFREFYRIAIAVVGVLLAAGIIGIPVRALVSSLVKERMEEVPKEELQEIVDVLDSQEVGADSFTREYTEDERSRMNELYSQYEQGIFPEGELPQTESTEEAEALEFCFLTTTSTFYLPDRELTDEELLQIIDFDTKRNYALRERYEEEYADEIAAREQEQKEQIAAVVDAGGITEQEAVIEAQKWLEKIYGITGEGLERNQYFEKGETYGYDVEGLYMVNWTDLPNRQYYYFFIDAQNGSLFEATYSGGTMVDEMRREMTPEELEKELPGLKELAVSFLAEKIGINKISYSESYLRYLVVDGENTGSNTVEFVLIEEDGRKDSDGNKEAYVVEYIWDGTFSSYTVASDVSDYKQQQAERAGYYQEFIERREDRTAQVEQVVKHLDEI